MCGIIGVLGRHQAAPIMVEALKRLEYRGYDSAGIATVDDGRLDRRRAVGKLANLADLLVTDPLPGFAGIGHTRWATHGAPTTSNAHPHRTGPVAVVHNGIVENFRALREELEADGAALESETDTETVAALAARHLAAGMTPVEAALATVDRLKGAFALAFLFDGHPDLMVVARQGSPLAVGHGDGEMFVGSDAIALAPLTDRITYLEEGDRAVVTRAGATFFDGSGREVRRAEQRIAASAVTDKGNYKHFMLKEIHEQPAVLADCLRAYADGGALRLPETLDFRGCRRVTIVACGTAYLAGLVAKHWIERMARIPVEVDVASEFRYREPPVPEGTTAIFVSQSGETADTLAALRYMKGKADRIVGVVNVATSTIARESDIVLPIHAGPEIAVASTKGFTCQLAVLALLALKAAFDLLGRDPAPDLATLDRLPGLMNEALGAEPGIESAAQELALASDALFLGRGAMSALALEGALKLKELSYIHAEGYASGELKHGPIALVDRDMPVIVVAPTDPLLEKTISNMQEVMAREGRVVLLTDAAGAKAAGQGPVRVLTMPEVPAILAPMIYAVPLQLLAYHTARLKGTDVDQPRNLAKSVTVE
ncbi:glutamine--fructose-6-phosphate transaminase [Hasllibacter halocynthiae]|uniref:Glutamine--fructose-6-phosphate aminotransferase [isomerizing] n=1 Tax=Hasllibacter halocynthiae TaxID=595589 RepID=A0A2T0X7W5_9RHOB|nr:glutamine--fructose-6-phosphate transaminase (isomerizing) [Hasllibacter halocynthiae]PRY95017.1 glutamine--fructose-6-phosphate transaminase [Hasllibacter halocynthiae]